MDHRCRRGEYCTDYEMVDGKRQGRAINATQGLCDTCTRHCERAIAALPGDYVSLNLALGRGSNGSGDLISMTREPPVPIRLHIEALQQDIVSEANAWAASVATVLNRRWVRHARVGKQLDQACGLLVRFPSVFLALRDETHLMWDHDVRQQVVRDGLDGALALLQLHHRAGQALGAVTLVHRLPVPCPACECLALEREDGTDVIDCTECARRFTVEEYEQLCVVLVGNRIAA